MALHVKSRVDLRIAFGNSLDCAVISELRHDLPAFAVIERLEDLAVVCAAQQAAAYQYLDGIRVPWCKLRKEGTSGERQRRGDRAEQEGTSIHRGSDEVNDKG